MFRSKFFWRNFLSYALIITITSFVISYLLTVKTEEFIQSNEQNALFEKLKLVSPTLNDTSHWNSEGLHAFFNQAARDTETRITAIDQAGYVIYESELTYRSLENHLDRPEIAQALNSGWGTASRYSETLQTPMLYVAHKVESGGHYIILRFAMSMSKLDLQLAGIRNVLGIGALVGMILSLLIAMFLAKRVTKPIAAITNVAEAISRGNYNARLRYLPKNELGTLGKSINCLAEAIQKNISQREKMEKIRREFSSNVSHELKTPLTSIKGYVETLEAGAIDDKAHAKRFLGIIGSNIERISTLVTDLLRLATIEANETLENLDSVHWKPIIQEVITRQEINLKNKNIHFQLFQDDNIGPVKGSRNAMTHILDNLMQNALNYTPEGGEIGVHLRKTDRSVLLTVEDTGIGIASKDQSRIFERFYRVDSARSRDDGGTGLGLAIVKHLVIQIQGTIKVSSQLNRGSKFTVSLPLVDS